MCILQTVRLFFQAERCPELAESLSNGNFSEFHTHLRGLISMYQIGATDK